MVDTVENLYFEWMCGLVIQDPHQRENYSNLLNELSEIPFYFTIPLDENRALDGADLRYRFGHDYNVEDDIIERELDNRPCSVLEMMVALAVRAEEHIMEDSDIGNQMGCWFLEMIESLKLMDMTNDNYDPRWVEYRITSFLNHEYEPNGEGGLFTVDNPRQDMRTVEIWYQMMWHLNMILK